MKHLSLRILAICLICPPLLYLLSVYAAESYARQTFAREIPNIYLGSTAALLAGEVRLKDAVHANIEAYLRRQTLVRLGMAVEVTVATETGVLLYPAMFTGAPPAIESAAFGEIARENFRLLNERPSLRVDVRLGPASPLSVGLLLACLLLGVAGLGWHYRISLRRAGAQELETQQEMARILAAREEARANLTALEDARKTLSAQLVRARLELESEKQRANDTEEQMIGELVAVEEKLSLNNRLQEEKEAQIETLRQELKGFEQALDQNDRRKQKDAAVLLKRFHALYKNIEVQERAMRGFVDLTDEMKIKAEEVIHLLNEDPDKVSVKRKVFGKKTTSTAFEVNFAYKGRLYFRKTPAQAVEVLAIGTKNSQGRDLGYIERL